MEDEATAAGHPRQHLARRRDVDQHGLRRNEFAECLRVGPLDPRMVADRRERPRGVAIALRRRLPVERDTRAARRDDVRGETLDPDVDHRR